MPLAAALRWASDRRVAWVAFFAATLLAALVLNLHGRWTPSYTDFGQVGDRYTFPLNGKIAEEDGVSFYWARCGHNDFCGPIAFRGDPPWGLRHVVLRVPAQDPAATQAPLPEPVEANCSWRGDCPDAQAQTVNVTSAWGPYEQAPVRAQQSLVGLASMLVAAAVANLRRGPTAGARAFLAAGAGVVLASGFPLDGTGFWVFLMILALPTLVVAGLLGLLSRRWPTAGRLAAALLWAVLAWVVQTQLFLAWFPGPPTE